MEDEAKLPGKDETVLQVDDRRGAISILLTADWWRFAHAFVINARPHTMKPAVMFSLGVSLPIVCYDIVARLLTSHPTYNGMGDVLAVIGPSALLIIGGSLGAAALVLIALAMDLIILTGLARAFLQLREQAGLNEATLDGAAVIAAQNEAVKHFYAKKAYILALWFIYTLFMTVPFVVWLVCLVILAGPFMPPPFMRIDLPPYIFIPVAITCGITTLLMTNYAVALMPCSAVSSRGATKAAVDGLVLSLKALPSVTLFSVLFIIFSSVVDNIIDIIVMRYPELATGDVPRYILILLKTFCSWILMFYILPFSVIVPCELLRRKLMTDAELAPLAVGQSQP